MLNKPLQQKSAILLNKCRASSLHLITAESCTGGLISSYLTAVPGSSDVVEGGVVTYSNDAKITLLGVPKDLLKSRGAVSKEVACAMAEGALLRTSAEVSIAVTGVAGPDGGTKEKPVGLVYFAVARSGESVHHSVQHFHGDREKIRLDTVRVALDLIERIVFKA